MLDMQAWQYVLVAVVGVISIGWMSFAIVRLFTRPASAKATVREATAVESGLTGATIPEGARVFDAWSYRVGARFAGRIRIAVYDERVAVAGPRIPRMLYQVWIWIQGLLLALVLPGIVAGAVTLEWRWIVAAVAMLVVSFCVSMGGAGLWPGLGSFCSLTKPASTRWRGSELCRSSRPTSVDARFALRWSCIRKRTCANSRACLAES